MDFQEPTPTPEKEQNTQTDEEILEIYNNSEEDSDEFVQAKAELVNRGYTFEDAEEASFESEGIVQGSSMPKNRYSTAGSLVWELLFIILSIGGAIYFLNTVESSGAEISTRTGITTALMVLFFSSTGVLVGAFRRLANQKGNPAATTPSGGYIVLMFLWSLCFIGSMYYAVRFFVEVVEYSFKYALISALLPLSGALISVAYATIFYLISRESQG